MKKIMTIIILIAMISSSLVFSIPVCAEESLFSDVIISKWYYSDVKYVYENRIMNGVTDTKFDPSGTLTRGMCATIIYRMAGSPQTEAENKFDDVKAGKYYTKAVTWAQSKGIVKGKTATTFTPEGNITRAEFATMLYRYLESADLILPVTREGSPIDRDLIPSFAIKAVDNMYLAEVINGRENGAFDPNASITRAETAAMIARFNRNAKASNMVLGVLTDNTVTLGWMINALYELEGKPEVTDWSPFDEISDMAIYDPDKTAEWNFWTITVKKEWYYKPLMWAIEHKLYVPFKYSTVIGDFSNSSVYKWEVIDLIAKYCEKFGIELPKVRDYPGFDDLDELENSDPNIIKVYESGLISESENGKLGLYEGEFTLDEAGTIIEKITAMK